MKREDKIKAIENIIKKSGLPIDTIGGVEMKVNNLAISIVDSLDVNQNMIENILYHEARVEEFKEKTIEEHLAKSITLDIITIMT